MSDKEKQEIADAIASIRDQLWQVTDEMPMTRRQSSEMKIIRHRLWRLFERLNLPLEKKIHLGDS